MLSITGQVKLLDFGLAQTTTLDEASAELTTVGQLMGTIDNMAPEQAEHTPVPSTTALIYIPWVRRCFGCYASRAAGCLPQPVATGAIEIVSNEFHARLAHVRADAPMELERLLSQLLSRSAESRPASAAHVRSSWLRWLKQLICRRSFGPRIKRAPSYPPQQSSPMSHQHHHANQRT